MKLFLLGSRLSRREFAFPGRKLIFLLGIQKTWKGCAFPAGKSENPKGISFSRREIKKAGRNSLFLPGIAKTHQEIAFPGRNT